MPFDNSESTTPLSGGALAPLTAANEAQMVSQPQQEGSGLLFSSSSGEGTPASQSIVPMLLRQKWLIAGICLAVCALAIPAIWIFIKPTYQSTAVVRVSPVVSRIVFKTEDNGIVPLYQSFLNTQISLIRDPRVLERVLDRKVVQQTDWYAAERRPLWGDPMPRLNRLRDDLKVQVRPQTELIDVSISTLQAADAQVIVDAVVDEYQTISDNEEKNRDSTMIETLKAERSDRERVITGLRDQKFMFLKQMGAVDTEQRRSQLSTDLGRLEFESAEVQRSLNVIRWQLARLSRVATQPTTGEADAATASAPALSPAAGWYVYDAEWRARDLEVKKARYEIERAAETMTEAHPKMKDLQAQLRFAEQLRADRQAAGTNGSTGIPGLAGPGGLAALEVLAQEHEQKLKLLEEDMKQLRGELKEAGEVSRQMADIDAKISKNSEVSGAIAARIEELQVEGKGPARIQIASHGLLPAKPARDRRILITVAALVGGLLAGMALAYLRGNADTTIREAGDVRRILQTPFLGQVCQSPSLADPIANSSAALLESIRMIRTTLLERLQGKQAPVILVTSPTPQTGKTSVSVLLARSVVQLGKKVLLVETDLRCPCLGRRLGIQENRGLVTLLAGLAQDVDPIVREEDSGLDLLLAGEIPDRFNAESLGNGILSRCLKRWKQKYDLILLDGPPVLVIADAGMLARQVDGTVMVLKARHCRRPEATQAYAYLSASGGTLLGTILVGGQHGLGSGYGYGYGYGYGSEGTDEIAAAAS